VSDDTVFDEFMSDQASSPDRTSPNQQTRPDQQTPNPHAPNEQAPNQQAPNQPALPNAIEAAASAARPGGAAPRGASIPNHPIERSSTGLSPRVAAALCYAAAWVGALAFLTFERQSRFVRFHAWQSVLGLGGLFALGFGLWVLAMLMAFVSAGAFRVFAWMSEGVWVALVVTWGALLVSALRGSQWQLPLVGKMAARRA
jgi:uncharacterized membrane protein